MKTLRSHVLGDWHEASDKFATLVNPSTEEEIARASSAGIDFRAVYEFARDKGGPALREMTFKQRGELLSAMSKALHAARDELIQLSLVNTGATRKDAKFDLDGATGTLSYYGYLAGKLGDGSLLADGGGTKLGRSARFWGQHVRVPLDGVAVLINAFNFPAWGFAEKAAVSLLAGVPVITKPATSTAMVAARCHELLVEAGVLPDGAVQFVCGSTGDLLTHLDSQDVLAFTGSADTALKLRSLPNLLRANTRVNLEADSLNAAVLAPDAGDDGETWDLFLRDVTREITQKTGQKCTAVRRIFVPRERMDAVRDALAERLDDTTTGNPEDGAVNMGPLATAGQLRDAMEGIVKLKTSAEIVYGSGERIDGTGSPAGKGYFFGPTLLCAADPRDADAIHGHEVFAPVATLLPYDGSGREAAQLVALGRGSLVTSVYSDDDGFVAEFIHSGGSYSGRLYLGSEKMAAQAPGSGVALPQSQHGGPGRAGGGAELAALDALALYTQRVALQGSRKMIMGLVGADAGEDEE